MLSNVARGLLIAGLVAGGAATVVTPAQAAAKTFANCTELNKVYKHGVAKTGARDKVSGAAKRVTNFKVSDALYAANKKSDRDRDGVACEKR
ncbi:excalibur calcium-binding domain-containing protein [Actinoplanes sp. NPDC049668]|uniref:excalibur calcium-binding domain-containing protein n=1 Tax=unclassified Actinoplanes TaxID=2626549 RepID=UPI0033B63AB2